MMWCMKCNKDLSKCTCSDLQERLFSVAGPYFAYKMCAKCKKHHAQCKCENPDWKIVGGKESACTS